MALSLKLGARHALAAAAALLLTAAGPGPAIQVVSCTVLQQVSIGPAFWYPYVPAVPHGTPFVDGVRIVYSVLNPISADRVAFDVNYRGDTQHIVDAGTFSTGATIDHTFGSFSGDAYLGPNPNSCTAVAARFIDGTTWRPTTSRLPLGLDRWLSRQ